MKNPLRKRLPRELKQDFAKYLVIFLFMTLTIGFVSGFLVAGGSMITAYDESFEKYNIEDGNFKLIQKADDTLIEEIEKEGVTLYPMFYADVKGNNSTIRVYEERDEVNKVCLMKGEMPQKEGEIAMDRMYADNNDLSVGDTIEVNGENLKITGLVALSDYSALFSDNTDMMFDSVKFGVAIVSKDEFAHFENLTYQYSWKYEKEPSSDKKEKELSDEFMKKLAMLAISGDGTQLLESYVPRYANQAIQFTGDDMGGDRSMMLVLLYILIVILAFVFAVTTGHTITKEAGVIGTLRASGYTRGEMVRHYLAVPVFVTLISALIGNILGYTILKNVVADVYYGSYSLPTYVTIWNGSAFIQTTVIPVILMIAVTYLALKNKLSLSPLQFLRHDLSKKKNKKAIRLPGFQFLTRFRLRIVFQNLSGYVILFIGIAFADILLLFGMMMVPLLNHYEKEVIATMPAKYQYVLSAPVEINDKDAEKYIASSLAYGDNKEDITIYGIQEESKYIKFAVPDTGVVISDGYAEKFGIKKGDKITLKEEYGDKEYTFEVQKIVSYPSALAVFMNLDEFRETFSKDEEYFNGYFSNTELTQLSKKQILRCITEEELTKVSRQLNVSMGQMFQLINVFAVALAAILIYLLTKLILEKNAKSISMVKILGYKNTEIATLYLAANFYAVVVMQVIGVVIANFFMRTIYQVILQDMTGWLTYYVRPELYMEMYVTVLFVFALVSILQFFKIQKIPKEEALKNAE